MNLIWTHGKHDEPFPFFIVDSVKRREKKKVFTFQVVGRERKCIYFYMNNYFGKESRIFDVPTIITVAGS